MIEVGTWQEVGGCEGWGRLAPRSIGEGLRETGRVAVERCAWAGFAVGGGVVGRQGVAPARIGRAYDWKSGCWWSARPGGVGAVSRGLCRVSRTLWRVSGSAIGGELGGGLGDRGVAPPRWVGALGVIGEAPRNDRRGHPERPARVPGTIAGALRGPAR